MAQHIQLKLMEGPLYKRGTLNRNWKDRWFVLTKDLELKYYESRSKSAESEMLGTDQNLLGSVNLLNIQLIQVSSVDKSIRTTMPRYAKYVRVLPTTDNARSYIIHLTSSSRVNTYVVSAPRYDDFKQWLAIFYKYIYGGIIFESFNYKQGKYTIQVSYQRRYFVLNEYKQIKYYNNRHRDAFHGYIDLNVIHSYNTTDIEAKDPPTKHMIQLNGDKRVWILCCDTNQLLLKWCEEFQKLGLKNAKKIGLKYYQKMDANAPLRTKAAPKLLNNEQQTMMMDLIMKTVEEKETQEVDDTTDAYKTHKNGEIEGAKIYLNEYPSVFQVKVDGLCLYQDVRLTQEVFGICMDSLSKDSVINGKHATAKVIRLENGYFCSFMELEEIGVTLPDTKISNDAEPSITFDAFDM